MMFGSFARLGFFWGPRSFENKAAVLDLSHFLQDLDSLFNETVDWTKSNGEPVSWANFQSIESLLADGVVPDDNRKPIQQLGHNISLNGSIDDSTCWLRVSCGITSPWVRNCCIFGFSDIKKLMEPQFAITLSELIVRRWNPEEGSLIDNKLYEKLQISNNNLSHEVGWIVYLSNNKLGHRFFPTSYSERSIEGFGNLYAMIVASYNSGDSDQVQQIKKSIP